jgi:transposase
MRQAHLGGYKLFVDYAGDTVPVIVDRLTGQVRPAQIFVAVMGASNFTYAEASWTQALADWIGCPHPSLRRARRRPQASGL